MRIIRLLFPVLLGAMVLLQIISLISSRRQSDLVRVCPTEAISMKAGKAVIDSNKCIGCQRCVIGVQVKKTIDPIPSETKPAQKSIGEGAMTSIPATAVLAGKPDPKNPKPQVSEKAPVKTEVVATRYHKVDSDQCIGCQLCVPNCPTQAITMVDGKARIDKSKCINCGICVKGNGTDFDGCPVNAISIIK